METGIFKETLKDLDELVEEGKRIVENHKKIEKIRKENNG